MYISYLFFHFFFVDKRLFLEHRHLQLEAVKSLQAFDDNTKKYKLVNVMLQKLFAVSQSLTSTINIYLALLTYRTSTKWISSSSWHHFTECIVFSSWYRWLHLALNNNYSLTHSIKKIVSLFKFWARVISHYSVKSHIDWNVKESVMHYLRQNIEIN